MEEMENEREERRTPNTTIFLCLQNTWSISFKPKNSISFEEEGINKLKVPYKQKQHPTHYTSATPEVALRSTGAQRNSSMLTQSHLNNSLFN